MLDIKALDQALQEIIKRRTKLYAMSFDSEGYDDFEDELMDTEDDFSEKYGDFIEDGVAEVYEQFGLEDEVLSAVSYIGRHYQITKDNQYGISAKQGLPVDTPDEPEADLKIILLPNPVRIFAVMGGKAQEAWRFTK